MDVGASAKIADGSIKLKSDAMPASYTPTGLAFSDGSHIDADLVVFATGFDNDLCDETRRIFGNEIGDQLEEFGLLTAEGEMRGLAKPLGHPGIWYHSGNAADARFFSRFLALPIAAELKGTVFDPWMDTSRARGQ
ncbi:hypothetical protein H2203_000249 [Taxawa tesnikishii (nom. ined.)]|nr:hypothetical protein H2203_000249 [Dothideales sp. JES 119]